MSTFPYLLADRLNAGDTVLTAWSSVPDRGFVSALAMNDFGAITLDMQHGGHHEASVLEGLEAVISRSTPSVVRIPVGRFDMASRALDFGADAVIAPMVNSVTDARLFAASVKYPPVGERSWGPTRAINLRGIKGGTDYLNSANQNTVSFAMIETREALAIVNDIAAVDGIDGLFVGPADFSIAWTGGERVDPRMDDMMEAIARIAQTARTHGKHAGIFAVNPADVPRFVEMGYRFIAVGFDLSVLSIGAKQVLEMARGNYQENHVKTGY
ncbi:MAG: aldolase/citrate lyase family protein [Pseudomonadota bacterium]